MKRKPKPLNSIFPSSKPPTAETFGTGEVAEVVDIPVWRLQKFLDSPQYQLSAEGKLGTGAGSRRVFTREDVCRIAIAKHLVQDGFAAKFVGSLLQQIEDSDFYEGHDEKGNETSPPRLLGLVRETSGPRLKLFPGNRPPRLGEKDSPYYLLNLNEVFAAVHEGIQRLRK